MKKSDINPMPEYFERYIHQIDDVELLQAFDERLTQLNDLHKNLPAKPGDLEHTPGKWTVKEIFQRIIDWERLLVHRTLLFARKVNSIPPNIDENSLAENMNAERRTTDDLIEELKIARLSTRAMFASFDDETLLTTGTNWKYEMSVLAMGFTIIGHQKHHLKSVEEKYYLPAQ